MIQGLIDIPSHDNQHFVLNASNLNLNKTTDHCQKTFEEEEKPRFVIMKQKKKNYYIIYE